MSRRRKSPSNAARVRKIRRSKIAALLLQDVESATEIAKKVNCAPATARRDILWLKEHDDKVRSHFGLAADGQTDSVNEEAPISPVDSNTSTESNQQSSSSSEIAESTSNDSAPTPDSTVVDNEDDSDNVSDSVDEAAISDSSIIPGSEDVRPSDTVADTDDEHNEDASDGSEDENEASKNAESDESDKTSATDDLIEKINVKTNELSEQITEDKKAFAKVLTGFEADGTNTTTFEPIEHRQRLKTVRSSVDTGAREVSSSPRIPSKMDTPIETENNVSPYHEDATESDLALGISGRLSPLAISESEWDAMSKKDSYSLFRRVIRRERMKTCGMLAGALVVFIVVFVTNALS